MDNEETQTNNVVDEAQVKTPAETGTDQKEQDGKKDDSIIDKLQKRIGKEQGEKHSLQAQLEQLRKENESLKKEKSIKDLSDEDKAKKADAEKDQRIAELENQLARTKALSETDAVFKESGLNVNEDILNMVVTDKSETTLANAQSLIDLIDQIKTNARKEALKGTAPRVHANTEPNAVAKALGIKQ